MSINVERNSNLEILRIFSMLWIIAFHARRTIVFPQLDGIIPIWINGFKVLLGSWGILGVDIFLIISVWFLVEKEFRTMRIVKIAIQTIVYYLAFCIVFVFFEYSLYHSIPGSFMDLGYYVLKKITQPLWLGEYWFVTAYIFMLLLSPLLNKIIKEHPQTSIRKGLIVFSFILIIAQFNTSIVCDIVYFAYIYVAVGYLKCYGGYRRLKKYARPSFCILISLFIMIVQFSMEYTNVLKPVAKLPFEIIYAFVSIGRHSMLILLLSSLIFLMVLDMKPSHNQFINTIASWTFGVYLFHENKLVNVCDLIMQKLNSLSLLNTSIWFPMQYFFSVFAIFVVGILIEAAQNKFIHRPIMSMIEKQYGEGVKRIDQWFNSL